MKPLDTWKELTRMTFIGSERAYMEQALMEELVIQGIDTDQDITGILLDSAALYRAGKKAGFPLIKMNVSPVPIVQAQVRYISSATFRFFVSILQKNTLPIQLEFIDTLKKRKLYIPPEFLPELIDHPAISFEFKINLPFITDKKGHWLLHQNPEWRYLIAVKDISVWKDAGIAARQVMIYHIRKHYPESVSDFVDAIWNDITKAEKKLLATDPAENDMAKIETIKPEDIPALLETIKQNSDADLNYNEMEALIKHVSLNCPEDMIEPILAAMESEPVASGKHKATVYSCVTILRWRYQLHEMLK